MPGFSAAKILGHFWQLAAAGYLIAIFILSSIPGLTPPPLGFAWQDKLYHFLEYTLLSLLLYLAFYTSAREKLRKNAQLLSLAIGVIYAASDEIHQAFVRNRNGDFRDWVADGVGVIAVQLVVFLFKYVSGIRKLTPP